MTQKDKAQDLVDKFSNYACWGTFDDEYENLQNSKKCALIAVDEMIKLYSSVMVALGIDKDIAELPNSYLLGVKQEIENL